MITLAVDLNGRLAVVVGGGQVAERKAHVLIEARARVRVISPGITPGLSLLHQQGQITAVLRPYCEGDLDEAFLAVAATGRPEVDAAVAAEAGARGRLISVSGEPGLGNVMFTAEVKRGPLSIAISTGGSSPAIARRIRREVERAIGPEYALLADILQDVRRRVKRSPVLSQPARAAIFDQILSGPALALLARGETDKAHALIHAVVEQAIAENLKEPPPRP